MSQQPQKRNAEIIKAFIAGNTNKAELARYFGVSPATVRRVLSGVVLSGVVLTVASLTVVQSADAALQGADRDAALQFINANAGMPQDMQDRILNSDSLETINNQLYKSGYYNQNTHQTIVFNSQEEIAPLVTATSFNGTSSLPPVTGPGLSQPVTEPDPQIKINSQQIAENHQTLDNLGTQLDEEDHKVALNSQRIDDLESQPQPQDGKDGIDGKDGADGTNGHDGIDGKDGAVGANGQDGINGKDGKDADMTEVHKAEKDSETALLSSSAATSTAVDAQKTAEGVEKQQAIVSGDRYQSMLHARAHAEMTAEVAAQEKQTRQQLKATEAKTQQSAKQQQRRVHDFDRQISELNHQAQENHAEVLSESHARAAGDQQTLQQSQNYTNQKFSDLKSQVDDNKKQANAGIAGVAAMANIPQVSQNATFSVGAGAGEYASEAGIAVGFSARINHNWVTKATIAGTTSNDPVIGAGFSAEW
jgi:hypothetical protein